MIVSSIPRLGSVDLGSVETGRAITDQNEQDTIPLDVDNRTRIIYEISSKFPECHPDWQAAEEGQRRL